MKLVELTGVKSLQHLDPLTLLNKLLKDGKLKGIGDGAYSEVMIGEHFVYKFWIKDSGYEKFIDFVKKHPTNPHLPKLLSPIKSLTSFFARPKDFPDKVRYIKVEKLEPITRDTKIRGTQLYVTNTLQAMIFCRTFDLAMRDIIHDNDGEEPPKSSIAELKSLYEVVSALFKHHTRGLDLHSQNIMKRADGTLVIIDPYGGAGDDDFEYVRNMHAILHMIKQDGGAFDLKVGPTRRTGDPDAPK